MQINKKPEIMNKLPKLQRYMRKPSPKKKRCLITGVWHIPPKPHPMPNPQPTPKPPNKKNNSKNQLKRQRKDKNVENISQRTKDHWTHRTESNASSIEVGEYHCSQLRRHKRRNEWNQEWNRKRVRKLKEETTISSSGKRCWDRTFSLYTSAAAIRDFLCRTIRVNFGIITLSTTFMDN